jgi:hypothetical protein
MFDGTLESFTTFIGGVNLKAFGVGIVKPEYGYITMDMLGQYERYEDLYDIHMINCQFCVAF